MEISRTDLIFWKNFKFSTILDISKVTAQNDISEGIVDDNIAEIDPWGHVVDEHLAKYSCGP